jgi:hypothetical protein
MPERRAAILRAEVLSRIQGNIGAVAFSRTGDSDVGVFDDAVVLKQFGEVPTDLTMLFGSAAPRGLNGSGVQAFAQIARDMAPGGDWNHYESYQPCARPHYLTAPPQRRRRMFVLHEMPGLCNMVRYARPRAGRQACPRCQRHRRPRTAAARGTALTPSSSCHHISISAPTAETFSLPSTRPTHRSPRQLFVPA